jgi:hypothetical protein
MSEIEVGEYVRTKEGYLGILIAINKQDYNYLVVDTSIEVRKDGYPSTYLYLKKENIKKYSKQLIDLIEQRDIVEDEYGKYEVAFISGNRIYCNDYNYDDSVVVLEEKNIETILTKEIYMAKCYKVGGKDE